MRHCHIAMTLFSFSKRQSEEDIQGETNGDGILEKQVLNSRSDQVCNSHKEKNAPTLQPAEPGEATKPWVLNLWFLESKEHRNTAVYL